MSVTPANFIMVTCTCPNKDTAEKIASLLLEKRLIACANQIPGIISHYWWEGKLEKSEEVLLLMKTCLEKFEELKFSVEASHPYEVPEIVAVPLSAGNEKYLEWIQKNVAEI